MQKKKLTLILFCIIIISSGFAYSYTSLTVDGIYSEDTSILLLMDDDWGANYNEIVAKFASFGWNITVASTKMEIISCAYNAYVSLDVDILVNDIDYITDITQFDCVNIMPGESHENLIGNQVVRDLINSAVNNDLVVSAWCRGVRVLADADVIDGKNVTGHSDYSTEYIAAGANFFPNSAPITDGNIITTTRSFFYQTDMCLAIAIALGVHEYNPPAIEEISFVNIGENNYNISIEFTDETGVVSASIILHALTDVEINGVPITTMSKTLGDSNNDDIFEGTMNNMPNGLFSVDVKTQDIFWNSITYVNATTFDTQNTNAGSFIGIVSSFIGIAFTIVITQVFHRKMRK
ncbi:MAG: DJ-1/PfpI family protein [Asgard group archaeon]|nr:DJ-1/PfpI family protein [Asgard group archaeon]